MKIPTVYLSGLFLVLFQITALAQTEKADSTDRFNDILINTRFIDYGLEYYIIDSKSSFIENHVLFQPIIDDKNIFNIELGIITAFQEDGNHTTPSDLSLSYQRNFAFRKYESSGYQGFAAKMKLVIPTGRDEYLSGFDSWTIEPLVETQWLSEDPNWFTSIQLRYSYSFATLPGKDPRFDFLRVEYFFGFESSTLWFFLTPDYRYVPSVSGNNLFLGLDFGYKIRKSFGLKAMVKPRIVGKQFYAFYSMAGFYLYL